MVASLSPQEKHRGNNFDSLRLVLAGLVVLAHSPELVDGTRSREVLTRVFGTLSFGDLAVDGFFLISGFLITKSFVNRRSLRDYCVRRFLRIVPGFAVCFIVCLVIVAPLAGSALAFGSPSRLLRELGLLVRLMPPADPDAFKGLSHPALNDSLWTIMYEFRCYGLAAILGIVGLYAPHRRRFVAIAVTVALILDTFDYTALFGLEHLPLLGDRSNVRFAALFGAGALFFLFRDRIRLNAWGAGLSACTLTACMFERHLVEPAVAVFGGYLIFWFAFNVRLPMSAGMRSRADLSYGLYLYAWPIQNLIVWHHRTIDPWLLCVLSLALAGVLAVVSWHLVERPAMRLATGRRGSRFFTEEAAPA